MLSKRLNDGYSLNSIGSTVTVDCIRCETLWIGVNTKCLWYGTTRQTTKTRQTFSVNTWTI